MTVNASAARSAAPQPEPGRGRSLPKPRRTSWRRPSGRPRRRRVSEELTSALAVLATPDWRCSVASSRIPIVSVMPGRSVTRGGECDHVRRRVEPGAERAGRREVGRDSRDRGDHRLRPGGSTRGEGDRADQEPDERCGDCLPPAAAEHGCQQGYPRRRRRRAPGAGDGGADCPGRGPAPRARRRRRAAPRAHPGRGRRGGRSRPGRPQSAARAA